MRFTLLLTILLGIAQVQAQSFSDSTYMDYGTQQPRSELIALDKVGGDAKSSKYVTLLDEWGHPLDNQNVYESKFTRPFSWIGRQLYLRVERVSAPYALTINGVEVARVLDSGSPKEFNITKESKEGRNIVTISPIEDSIVGSVEGWEHSATPALGEVYITTQPTIMVRDVNVSTITSGDNLYSQINLAIKSHALGERRSTIHYSLHREDGSIVTFGDREITLSMRGEDVISFTATIPKSEGWSVENPQLFTLKLKTQYEGRYLEYQTINIGFRAIEIDPTTAEILINDTPVTLTAKSINSAKDIDVAELKSQGFNAIVLRSGVNNASLYEMCDREGLYIISTMPINSSKASRSITKGGNPSNDPKWWGAYMQRVEVGYHTTQLHPSVVAFSLADSSMNGYNLYEGFLRLKQKGDSRPILYFDANGEWNSDNIQIDLQ